MSHIYVVGEVEEPTGPVRIGMRIGAESSTGRSGLSGGNWRQLEVLHRWALSAEQVRWTEWVVHRNLRSRHVRGEWFDVRRPARRAGGWEPFLVAAYDGKLPDLSPWSLRRGWHRLRVVDRLSIRPRHFVAACSCGDAFDGGLGRALDTVLVAFATEHLGLDPVSDVIRDIKSWRMHLPSSRPAAK